MRKTPSGWAVKVKINGKWKEQVGFQTSEAAARGVDDILRNYPRYMWSKYARLNGVKKAPPRRKTKDGGVTVPRISEKYAGVTFDRSANTWKATVPYRGKDVTVGPKRGCELTEKEAALVYDAVGWYLKFPADEMNFSGGEQFLVRRTDVQ